MLSTKEVASLLGCTKRNVTRMVAAKQLKPINQHERFFLFDEKEVLTFKDVRDGKR